MNTNEDKTRRPPVTAREPPGNRRDELFALLRRVQEKGKADPDSWGAPARLAADIGRRAAAGEPVSRDEMLSLVRMVKETQARPPGMPGIPGMPGTGMAAKTAVEPPGPDPGIHADGPGAEEEPEEAAKPPPGNLPGMPPDFRQPDSRTDESLPEEASPSVVMPPGDSVVEGASGAGSPPDPDEVFLEETPEEVSVESVGRLSAPMNGAAPTGVKPPGVKPPGAGPPGVKKKKKKKERADPLSHQAGADRGGGALHLHLRARHPHPARQLHVPVHCGRGRADHL